MTMPMFAVLAAINAAGYDDQIDSPTIAILYAMLCATIWRR